MARYRRGIVSEYNMATDLVDYYGSIGDARSATVMRFHQSQIALEMVRRGEKGESVTQRQVSTIYGNLVPSFSENETLRDQVRQIRQAQQRAVLYVSKVPHNTTATAGLFWTRQGRVDLHTRQYSLGKTWVSLCASSLLVTRELTNLTDSWMEVKPGVNAAILHSGIVAGRTPRQPEDIFVEEERQVALVVGAPKIKEWADTQQEHPVFGFTAQKLAYIIGEHGISNAPPADYMPKARPAIYPQPQPPVGYEDL